MSTLRRPLSVVGRESPRSSPLSAPTSRLRRGVPASTYAACASGHHAADLALQSPHLDLDNDLSPPERACNLFGELQNRRGKHPGAVPSRVEHERRGAALAPPSVAVPDRIRPERRK